MNTKTIFAIILLILIIAGGYWYMSSAKTLVPVTVAQNDQPKAKIAPGGALGTYRYECDEHVQFTMTPAEKMISISIAPVNGATFPPSTALIHVSAGQSGGRVFQGNGITLTGRGESVTLASARSGALNCSPIVDSEKAPFNFGE